MCIRDRIGYIDVTGFDVDNDKISGKAAPDAWVEVTVFISGRDFQEFPRRSVQADANGDWTADFSVGGEGEEPWAQPFDLEPGCQGFAEQRAEGGGVTRFDWRIPVSYTHLDVYKRQATLRWVCSSRS